MDNKKYSMHEETEDSGIFSFNSTAADSDVDQSLSFSRPDGTRSHSIEDISLEVDRSLARLDKMQLSSSASEPMLQAPVKDVIIQNDDGDTDLHIKMIVGASDEEILRTLRSLNNVTLLNTVNNRRQSCLYLAVLTNRNPFIVCYMLSMGADMRVHDRRGNTPLHIACRNGNLELLDALVTNASDPSQLLYQRNYAGQTCLHLTAEYRHLRIIQYLNNKMDINAQEGLCGKTILHQCIDRVIAGECSLFLKALLYIREIDVNARTFGDLRPLDLSKGHELLTSIFSVYKQCDDNKRNDTFEDCELESDIMMDYDDFQIAGQAIQI